MAWRWVTNARSIARALIGLENTMGAAAEALAGVSEQITKVGTEILGKLDELATQLANAGKLDQADLDAIQAVREGIQRLDDIVPDPVVEPEQPAEPAPSDPVEPTE